MLCFLGQNHVTRTAEKIKFFMKDLVKFTKEFLHGKVPFLLSVIASTIDWRMMQY